MFTNLESRRRHMYHVTVLFSLGYIFLLLSLCETTWASKAHEVQTYNPEAISTSITLEPIISGLTSPILATCVATIIFAFRGQQ